MRLAGASWDQITERLEYASKGAACKDFLRAMQANQASIAENATLLKQIELMRLDRLQAAFWGQAAKGDTKAGRMCLDIHKARVALTGIDAAQRSLDNAVDGWLAHLGGGDDSLDPDDAAALDAVA